MLHKSSCKENASDINQRASYKLGQRKALKKWFPTNNKNGNLIPILCNFSKRFWQVDGQQLESTAHCWITFQKRNPRLLANILFVLPFFHFLFSLQLVSNKSIWTGIARTYFSHQSWIYFQSIIHDSGILKILHYWIQHVNRKITQLAFLLYIGHLIFVARLCHVNPLCKHKHKKMQENKPDL